MHTVFPFEGNTAVEVLIEFVCIERCERCHQSAQGLETRPKGLVGADLIGSVIAFPEATTTETHVPVGEFFCGKLLDRTEGTSRLESFHSIDHLSNQRIEFRQNPLVHFWTVGYRNWRFLEFEAIYVCVQREESVSIVKGAKEFAANFV